MKVNSLIICILFLVFSTMINAQIAYDQGRRSIYSAGSAPDNAYNGNLVITKPAASGQYINLIRAGNYPWSIGTVYNNSNFGIGTGTGSDDAFSPFFVIDMWGRVGIGSLNPEKTLQINASNTDAGLRLHAESVENNSNTPYLLLTGGNKTNNGVALQGVSDQTYGRKALAFYSGWDGDTDNPQIGNLHERMRISSNGNVGVGTLNPQAKLDVGAFIDNGQTGTIFGHLAEGNTTGDGTYLGVKGYGTSPVNSNSFAIEHHFYGHTNSSINFFRGGGTTGGFITFNTSDNSEKMRINANGNVSIGTTETDPNVGVMLTVKGSIHTTEVIVDLKAPLADYVFKPTYQLMPLHQVESYVKTNSHLPEMPSAEEVSKNGMSMGEMQNKLLQKVEELTLYVIEQNKKIEQQSIEINQLKQQLRK